MLNRYGVTDIDIDNYLKGCNKDSPEPMSSSLQAAMEQLKASGPALRSCRPKALVEASRKIEIESPSHGGMCNDLQVAEPRIESDRDKLSPLYYTGRCSDLSDTQNINTDKQRLSSVTEVATDDSSDSAPGGGDDMKNIDDTTACEAAAEIIANMRGHNSATEILADLGCSGDIDCVVKNTTVFQVMDQWA